MKNPRFQWSFEKTMLFDGKTKKKWTLRRCAKTGKFVFECDVPDDWGNRYSPACTRKYTALRSLMRLIAKEDKKCAKPIKRVK